MRAALLLSACTRARPELAGLALVRRRRRVTHNWRLALRCPLGPWDGVRGSASTWLALGKRAATSAGVVGLRTVLGSREINVQSEKSTCSRWRFGARRANYLTLAAIVSARVR